MNDEQDLRIEWMRPRVLDEFQQVKEYAPLLGHVARKDGLTKNRLLGAIPGKRGRGRPKTRMSDNVKDIVDISMAASGIREKI